MRIDGLALKEFIIFQTKCLERKWSAEFPKSRFVIYQQQTAEVKKQELP